MPNAIDKRTKVMAKRIALTAFMVMALVWGVWAISGQPIPRVDSIYHRQKVMKDGRVVMISVKSSSPSAESPQTTASDSLKSDSAVGQTAVQTSDTSVAATASVNEQSEEKKVVLYRYSFRIPLPFTVPRVLDPLFASLLMYLMTLGLNHSWVRARDSRFMTLCFTLMVGLMSGLAWGFLVGLLLSALFAVALILVGAVLWLAQKIFSAFYNWVSAVNYKTQEATSTKFQR